MDEREVKSVISESDRDVFQVVYNGEQIRLKLVDATFDEVSCVVFSKGSSTYRVIARSNKVFLEKYDGLEKRFVDLGIVEDIR